MNSFQQLTEAVIRFRDARDWAQFHNPKDLSVAISIEAGELLELFLWKGPQEADAARIKDELADILSFALLLANELRIDLNQAVLDKLAANELRYPVDKAKGNAKKHDEL